MLIKTKRFHNINNTSISITAAINLKNNKNGWLRWNNSTYYGKLGESVDVFHFKL